MNAMNYSMQSTRTRAKGMSSDTIAELARHSVDLRIHALVMFCIAMITGYCAFRTSGVYGESASGDLSAIGMPMDLLSIGSCVVFAAISFVCVAEAHRFWKKSTTVRAQLKVGGAAKASEGALRAEAYGEPMAAL